MKRLDGREVAGFIQERHAGIVRGIHVKPRLVIVRQGATRATDMYLRVKQRYGQELGVAVDVYTEAPTTLLQRIHELNDDATVTGIAVELPFADEPELTDRALAAVALSKDVDGLAPNTSFEVATPKAIRWLLAAYNVELKQRRIVVVGQGRLVGAPLADQLEASGLEVVRADEHTKDLARVLIEGDIIISATGQAGLITTAMVKPGAALVDAGAPKSDLDPTLYDRDDLAITPNPGGVGPMTVAALFDNLLIAAQKKNAS